MRVYIQYRWLNVAIFLLFAFPVLFYVYAYKKLTRKSQAVTTASTQYDHYYVARSGDAFKYVKIPISDSTDESYVLVWNLGTRGGEPAVRYQDGSAEGMLICYDTCQFVYGMRFKDGKVIQTGRIRVTNDPLIEEIMRDAIAGRLSKK